MTNTRGNTPTPAALILLQAGISGRQLADELGVTPQAVSYQLVGKTAETSPDLLEAIAELAGDEVARAVAAKIEDLRGERLRA